MDSCAVQAAIGFKGKVKGRTGSPKLEVRVRDTLVCDFSGTGRMFYDAASDGAELTIAAGATETFDLTGGRLSPLVETVALVQLYWLAVVHDPASLASKIRVFDQTSTNLWSGPLENSGKIGLLPGRGFAFIVQADKTGETVDATHRKIDVINLDGSNAATVRISIMGKV